MKKNKKVIFAAIGAALLIGLIIALLCIKSGPHASKVTIEHLFEKNRNYFNNLTSMSVTSNSDLDIIKITEDGLAKSETKIDVNKFAYTKIHCPTNTAFSEFKITQHKEDRDAVMHLKMYKIKDGDEFQLYYADNMLHAIDSWFTNKTDERIEQFMTCQDFKLIEEREMLFKLEEETVDINGVKCYKATARFFNIKEVVNYYNIRDMIGAFGNQFMDLYIDVSIYFRADTEILYCVEYDASDLLNRVSMELRLETVGDGTLTTVVYFEDFDTFDEIVVSDEFKENVTEYHGDPIIDPIDIDNQYLETFGDTNFKFGQLLKDYADTYEIVRYVVIGEELSDIIPAKSNFDVYLVNDDNKIFVTLRNISNEDMNYLDCPIISIKFESSTCKNFDNMKFGSNLSSKSTAKECIKALGRYTNSYNRGDVTIYQWTSYIDYCEVEIAFDNKTGKMQYYQIYSWDLKYFLYGPYEE